MPSRRAVLIRDAEPGALLVQPRDREIVRACWDYQGLTRIQLQRLLGFGTATRINDRLRRLYDQGLLERIRVPSSAGGSLLVYVPGSGAVSLLAGTLGLDAREVRRAVLAEAVASPLLRPHDLAMADFRIAITHWLGSHPPLRLERWRNARETLDRYDAQHAVRPDGLLQVWVGDVLHSLFLEWDCGTVDLARWTDKVRRYQAYADTGAFTRRYDLRRFRVAVVVPDAGRLRRLYDATRAVTDRRFWFALASETRDGDLTRPVWQSLTDGTLRPLIAVEE